MFVSVGAIIHYKISIPKHNILNFTFVVFVSRLLLAIFAPIKELFSAVITFLITTIPILCNEGYLITYDEHDMVIGITHTVVNIVDVLD